MRHQMPLPELTIVDTEHHDLLVLTMAHMGHAADDLFYKLERMRIVSSRRVPPEVVGMGSSIAYRSGNGDDRQMTLVYPADADASAGQVSVLNPIGTALLGLRAGHSTTWTARDGCSHLLRVLSVRQSELVD